MAEGRYQNVSLYSVSLGLHGDLWFASTHMRNSENISRCWLTDEHADAILVRGFQRAYNSCPGTRENSMKISKLGVTKDRGVNAAQMVVSDL